ncbi:uncharacterized protein WCC33_009181 [Rhinophrynus dorsalis]
METRRQPLKRLCTDSGIESPRKKRFTELDEGTENHEPIVNKESECLSKGSWSSLLRITEQEIKPDTPAIASVRSRIQMLRDVSRKDEETVDSVKVGEKSWTEKIELVLEEWKNPDKKSAVSRKFAKLYPFSEAALAQWAQPPKVDAPMSRLSKFNVLLVEDASVFKDWNDRKLEAFLKAIFVTAGTSLLLSFAAAWGVVKCRVFNHAIQTLLDKELLEPAPELEGVQDSSELKEHGRKKEATEVTGHTDVRSVMEKFEWKPVMEDHPSLPVAQSTIAPRRQHPSKEDKPPSLETATRLRKEREEELAMVSAMLDHQNPWRAESMRHRKKRKAEHTIMDSSREIRRRRRVRTGRGKVKMGPALDSQSDSSGSDSGELSLETSDGLLDISEERYVSSLEVRLQGALDNDSYNESTPLLQEESSSPSYEQAEELDAAGLSSNCFEAVGNQVTMNSSELIDCLFQGVLDSSSGSAEEPIEREPEIELPPVSILSPLTKSIALQAAISPLSSVVSSLPELLVDPAVPLKLSAPEDSHLPYSTTILLLSKEVSTLQRIIEQACRALSYCVDAEHGKGTRQEAEAERLLLVSTEKRQALLKELDRLRSEASKNPEPCPSFETLKPCHGSVTISDIRLPLKVDYVCSPIRESGFPSHYFLILIRFGSYDVVATPLASAADAQTGDTILFPTKVTLNDVASDFKIEIEVYSMAPGSSVPVMEKRKTLKPKITPKKLLGSRKSSLNSPAYSPVVGNILRPSSFLLVGSLTISLESLGKMKFSLEKMKLEGKLGRILGNHFQNKVPFLSPLEGSLYLKMHCQSHSSVQRSGFLTMFEDVSGLGAWHRRWCVLSANNLSFWTYPDQETLKEPLGQINLVNCTSAQIEPAKRETCARPNTLELITMRPQREDDVDNLVTQCRNTLCFTKNWLSADTKEERNQWMECLNQVLVDLRTWSSRPGRVNQSPQGWQTRITQPCQLAASNQEKDC